MPYVELRERLGGVSAIPVCAFTDSGLIDEKRYQEQIEFLRLSGVDAIVPCGNTSEYFSLSDEEAKRLVDLTAEVLDGRVPMIVGVGRDLETAVGLSRHAEQAGADGVMVHHPHQPFVTGSGVVEYLERVANEVEIAVLPYVRSDVLRLEHYQKLFELPNVVAVKHATNDVFYAGYLCEHTKEFPVTWICGSAEGWAPFYSQVGAHGFTSGLVNVFPSLTLEMRDALRLKDYDSAMRVWHQIQPFEEMRAKENGAYNVTVVKTAMDIVGRQGGRVRPPAAGLRAEDRSELERIVAAWK